MPKLFGGLVPFRLIAGVTGQHEVGDAVASSPAPREQMVNLEALARLTAVGAAMLPFGEQVLAHFHPFPRALLIGQPHQHWISEQGCVELHQLQIERTNGTPAPKALDPGQHIGEAALQGGREPPGIPASVLISGLPIARVALSP